MRRFGLQTIASIAAASALIGFGSIATLAKAPALHKIGSHAFVMDYGSGANLAKVRLRVSVLKVRRPTSISQAPFSPLRPKHEYVFLEVGLRITDEGSQADLFSADDELSIQDAAGHKWTPDFGADVAINTAFESSIVAHATRSGYVVFAVPVGKTGLRFVLQTALGSAAWAMPNT